MITLDQGGRRRGTVRSLDVASHLRGLVDALWIDAESPDHASDAAWRIVADDAPHLIFATTNGAAGRQARLSLVGARAAYADIRMTDRAATVALRLRPGALPALFGVSAVELTGRAEPLEIVDARLGRGLVDRLASCSGEDVAAELSCIIERCAMRGRPLDERARWLQSHEALATPAVAPMAAHFGISDRALRLWSRTHLGIGVKSFMRIRRLHRALGARMSNGRATWSQIAAHTGYADHAHLTRDCQLLLGESPSEFLARGRR